MRFFMRVAEITINPINITKPEKVMNKLSWRDSWIENGEVQEIIYEDTGGAFEFKYNPKTKRMVPHIVDVYSPIKMSTAETVKKYVDKLEFPHEIISNMNNIILQVKEEDVPNFKETIAELDLALSVSKICTYRIDIKGSNY